ncbi:hypothetical protein [Streptomyces griseomycini]|uniref:Uncharacterized protein n=1 Tax=Streptomyces griseomycini TaxID=66895 RepID=A0A7W7PWM5_9ACTN|nr:hypothetical protein [Streptomyces griseomycini]MBB4902717.1 hypothetical protein [Streptomyces griseomycini]GGR60182.1 hypothetical protein GCM10015536_75490 [Streptomyces griseomycini]
MNGHDPLGVIALLLLFGVGISVVGYRWPTVGAAIDLATKVVLACIGALLFASGMNAPSVTPVPEPTQPTAPTADAPAPASSTPPGIQ